MTGKLHSQKQFIPDFKTTSSGTCLVFASDHGYSTLPSKATVRESPPSSSKHQLREHNCHSECNVHCPKVPHCLLHDCDIAHSEILISSLLSNTEGASAFMFCFTHGGKQDTTLLYLGYENCNLVVIFSCILFILSSLRSFHENERLLRALSL